MASEESRILSQEQQLARVKEICETFHLSDEQLLNIKNSLLSEIDKGLKVATNHESSTKCWPTFIQEYPNGCEHGLFLILEIRDYNFDISLMHLKGSPNYYYEKETHATPKELYTENVEVFFDFMVDKLKRFIIQHNLEREHLSMALCLAFPIRHTRLNRAIVQSLHKNLDVIDIVGTDVVELMQQAIKRSNGFYLHVETVLNNSTAILLANSWQGECCQIGINIGPGFNAVYIESLTEIEMSSEQTFSGKMIVNTEWSEYGANGHLDNILTIHDKQVDEVSKTKDCERFEKLVSGLYLGELARQIFLQCVNEKILFGGYISDYLRKPFSFTSRYVNEMLTEEDTETFDRMRLQFDKMGISMPDAIECSKVYSILKIISQRSAQLVACGIISLAEKISQHHIVIGLGGTLYLDRPIYQTMLTEKLHQLMGTERTFELKSLANDIPVGAALSAAISKNKEFLYHSEQVPQPSDSAN